MCQGGHCPPLETSRQGDRCSPLDTPCQQGAARPYLDDQSPRCMPLLYTWIKT